jgi:hypothetical protein
MGMDSARRNEIINMFKSVPKHLVNLTSWRTVLQNPKKSFLWIIGPYIYTFRNRRKSDSNSTFQTALERIVDLIDSQGSPIALDKWLLTPSLTRFVHIDESIYLKNLLSKYRSDKSALGYSEIYQVILSEIKSRIELDPIHVVEIGIGSTDPGIPSNMTVFGNPGASLRSFRDLSKDIYVTGGDIDSKILFEEERIKTYKVNQLESSSIRNFLSTVGSFNLLIDDGLHQLDANLNTLTESILFAKPGSWIVIEDISHEPKLSKIWTAIGELISKRFFVWLIECPKSYVFVAYCRFEVQYNL